MSFKKSLLAGAVTLTGVMAFHMPAVVAADVQAEMPKQEQRAVDNAQPTHVAAQIKELHDKLHIVPAQEERWKDVADAMQSTATEVRTKLTSRADKVKTVSLSAVDELRAYKDLQQVQYDGVNRLMGPFEKLYDVMSSEQKKNADEVFEQPRMEAKAAGGGERPHKAQ